MAISIKTDFSFLAAANEFSSTDGSRYPLCGVMLDLTEQGLLMIATNGWAMGVVRDGNVNHFGKRINAIIPSQLIQDVWESIGCRGYSDRPIEILLNGDEVTIVELETIGVPTGRRWANKLIDGVYPDWRKVVKPEALPDYRDWHVNPHAIESTRRAAALLGHFSCSLVMAQFADPDKPDEKPWIVARINGDHRFFSIIKPMINPKCSGEIPGWMVGHLEAEQ